MATNTPVNPNFNASEIQQLSGAKEFFLKKALDGSGNAQTLTGADLIPVNNLADDTGYPAASVSNVQDVPLAGGGTLKVPSTSVNYSDLTLEIYLPPSNAVLQSLENAVYRESVSSSNPPNKNAVFKWNFFAPDAVGYGWGGLAIVSSITPTDDNGFHYTVVLSVYNVFRIRA